MTKGNLDAVIRGVLAHMSEAYGFRDVGTELTLRQLGLLDESAIAEFKARVYRTLSGTKTKLDFEKFSAHPVITLDSTVGTVLRTTRKAVLMSLPGNDPTKLK